MIIGKMLAAEGRQNGCFCKFLGEIWAETTSVYV